MRMSASFSVFEGSLIDAVDPMLFWPQDLFQNIIQMRVLSRCMTLILASNDLDFLTAFVRRSAREDVIVWPTKLLVVTRQPRHRLIHLRQELSNVNGMVMSLAGSLDPLR
ncbi:uncharacterized protein [Macrobrachium rosenbergii]|uniref:uncharacterized protein n=1 Tax=Macrobrachium rosenbergii TaxID=79674 RepID=UPI0034D746DE